MESPFGLAVTVETFIKIAINAFSKLIAKSKQ